MDRATRTDSLDSLTPNPEDAYGLTPMQVGMLYQSLLGDGAEIQAGYDIEQVHVHLPEPVNAKAMESAWNIVLDRYSALTHAFSWDGSGHASQRSYSDLRVPFAVVDWRDQDAAEARSAFLGEDRLQGFDLHRAPLMRVTLARTGTQSYELIWTFHHILIDGRCFAHILDQVFKLSSALEKGQALPSKASATDSCPQRGYVEWLSAQDDQASRDYFKQLLQGKQAPTPLPLSDIDSHSHQDSGYDRIERPLSAPLREALVQLAQRANTTLGCLLQSAWALLLYRLTGDADVVFGVTRSCRSQVPGHSLDQAVGLFINTLPARLHIDEHSSIEQFLSQTRQQWNKSREHLHLSLSTIQGLSDISHEMGLFQTLVMYEDQGLNAALQALDARWKARPCQVYDQPSPPLTLIAREESCLELTLVYDRTRYQNQTAGRLANYFVQLLSSLIDASTVADVDLLPSDEFNQTVFDWNDTRTAFDDQLLIHQLFERQASAQPDAVAVECDSRKLSYAELDSAANRIANALRRRGLGPGDFVGFCTPRDERMLVAMLGIAKSGAAYLPIEPEYPAERIRFMLEDTQASVVLTTAETSIAPDKAMHLDSAEIQSASDQAPTSEATSQHPCYVIFTSGSTGKPKGVVLCHRAVINTLQWVNRELEIKSSDRLLFVTSPCFDLSVYDVFGTLGAGGTVVIASSNDLGDPARLVEKLVHQRITIWDSAPAALDRLVPLLPRDGGGALRRVLLSGDWIPLTLPDAIRASFPSAEVISLGGATEAAIWSNWFPVGPIDPRWNSVPYGKPIQNARYYVLDPRRKPVPVGVSGDLYIAGSCVAEGYLGREELTRERFMDSPFHTGERMYMTGDIARYFPDGNLEFLGRADFQVKIRGYRVELGEVEAALLAIPDVASAACVAHSDVSGALSLSAYLTSNTGSPPDLDRLRRTLAERLPDFMIPARYHVLDEMPLSANGKLDRKALPQPTEIGSAAKGEAPKSDAEKRLATIWCQLLKRESVYRDDNFFEIGGDSLLVVSLGVEIQKQFAIELPLARILEHPSLRGLAAAIEHDRDPTRRLVTLNPEGSQVPMVLFCGVGGHGFFFHDFARALGSDWPVHVVQAIGVDNEDEDPRISIEEMAEIYEPEILQACPRGPIVVGGYSFGALLAYEMCRRLSARGREVRMLVSFDGPAPGYPRKLPAARRIVKHLKDWHALQGKARREYVRERIQNIKRRFTGDRSDPRFELENADSRLRARLQNVEAALWNARDQFCPEQRIQCPVLLLRAEEPVTWPGCEFDPQYCWQEFSTLPVNISIVPGSHLRLFGEANNTVMADAIRKHFAELEH